MLVRRLLPVAALASALSFAALVGPADAGRSTRTTPKSAHAHAKVSAKTKRATAKARTKARRRAALARACVHRARSATPGRGHRGKPIGLTVEQPPKPINFAHHPGKRSTDVVLKADRRLPRSIKPENVVLDVTRSVERDDDNLETTSTRVPKFTTPRFNVARNRVYFRVCINGAGMDAGSYSGTVTASGPAPLGQVDVPLTVRVKRSSFFWSGTLVALAITLLFLLYKELRNDAKVKFADWKAQRAPDAKADVLGARYFLSLQSHFGIDFLVLECIVPLGIAFAAIYGIYSSTPSWGADGVAAWTSLVTAGLTAAGVRSLIVTATPAAKPAGDAEPAPARAKPAVAARRHEVAATPKAAPAAKPVAAKPKPTPKRKPAAPPAGRTAPRKRPPAGN